MSPAAAARAGAKARRVMRHAGTASLGTALAEANNPEGSRAYVSLVLACLDLDASPLLLLSTLAEHTRNLQRDPRASLLFEATAGLQDPLTGPRVTVLGRLAPVRDTVTDERLMERFAARHPGAAQYRGFADFALYRLEIERAHLVAGFGEITWIEAADLVLAREDHQALAAAEAEIVAHMNHDHRDAVALIARHTAGLKGRGWRLTGVDPEGADFRRGGQLGRAAFDKTVDNPGNCRRELVRLTRNARAKVT